MLNKRKVAELYGSKTMIEAMSKGKPNAFVLFALSCVDVTGLEVLEMCCGTGYISNALAERGARVTGLDISAAAIAYAQQHAHKNAKFVQMDVESLVPQPDYDIVLIPFGLQYMQDPRQLVEMALACLKPGGSLIIADAYKVGRVQATLGIPGQIMDLIKFGRSQGNSLADVLKLIVSSAASFELLGLPEWKQLERDVRIPLNRHQIIEMAAEFGGRYTQIGNSYFVLEMELRN